MDKASFEQVKHEYLQTRRTGRIATLGKRPEVEGEIWIVLHGYRMLANNFVRKFQPWVQDGKWIVAPEGLSRFYVEGFRGRVGASWMTSEERLSEIEDQRMWLDRVWEWVNQSLPASSECKIHVLGFSQGVATLWRWLESSEIVPDSIVFYAGKIPEEFSQKMDGQLAKSPIVMAYGSEDQFLTEERVGREMEILAEHMPHARVVTFEGKHDIYPEALEKISKALDT